MIDVLRNLLAPGGRSRISPYVQDAQFDVLFGRTPDASDRQGNLRNILKHHDDDLQKIAETFIRFRNDGRPFKRDTYASEQFLPFYLAYYFTTNLPKVQLCLLDLVEKEKIAETVTVVDIGVGSGTTAVAVLDFLLAWSTACHLFDRPFPVQSLRLECYDSSPECLRFAERVLAALCQAMARRKASTSAGHGVPADMDRILAWGRSADWRHHDMARGPILHGGDSQVILFASNVLNELTEGGRKSLATTIHTMPTGSLASIIEPGDRKRCCELNDWKSQLQRDSNLRILVPCGDGTIGNTSSCSSCWNSRREAIQEPLLYRSLRERAGDTRSFDEYSNTLLSWSYAVLEQETLDRDRLLATPGGGFTTRVLGTFRQQNQRKYELVRMGPDEQLSQAIKDLIKLCPATAGIPGARSLVAERQPGFVMPCLPHGAAISILNAPPFRNPDAKDGLGWMILLGQGVEIQPLVVMPSTGGFLSAYGESARAAVDEVAFRLFGFPAMRPFQHEILGRVLTGLSILGIAATGGGKSECYMLPAMLFSGVTIVISPLKSLMQDQLDKRIDERYGLRDLATFINGDVPFPEREARLKRMELGYYKLVYFTPEQLRQAYVLNALKRTNEQIGIRYLALDEAHCISQWGHDFRDSYLNLLPRLAEFGIVPVRIALTATASPEVRADLCEELNLVNAPLESGGDVYVHSSNRAELNLIVKAVHSTEDKVADILHRLDAFIRENARSPEPGAAIVFMPWAGNPDTPASYLREPDASAGGKGRHSAHVTHFASYLEQRLQTRVAIYYSKMDSDRHTDDTNAASQEKKRLGDLRGRTRRIEQNTFMEGHCAIMVATKGFGMGIDKPDIRLIIHRTPTANLEAYAQEAGRAGRDGKISDVVLYYSPDPAEDDGMSVKTDYDIQNFFLSDKHIRKEDVVAMRTFLSQVETEVCGRLYFTSDEILPFFDELARQESYAWPDFPPRRRKGRDFAKHQAILNRGHLYTQKAKHVERILSALYRIRPDVRGRKRLSLVSSFQEVGAVIVVRDPDHIVLNSRAIVESNYYFGELLREKGVTPDVLERWIMQGLEHSIIPFARHLSLPLSALVDMLLDMKTAEGQWISKRDGGRWWKPSLLDFRRIEPPRFGAVQARSELAAWRDYAGATERAHDAYERAKKAYRKGQPRDKREDNGEPVPNLDDWFGWEELSRPKGWEVVPGPALTEGELFREYITEFMAVHDRRKDNDRAAYRLLLTDYVGVNEDGSLPAAGGDKPCLRAVLLGYLKTGEVVQGNCGSCSRCVPDGRFEQDLTKREKVVERLGTEVKDLLDALEASPSRIPAVVDLQSLWQHVDAQEAVGRSLRAYVEGWTGRLLTDSPGHKAAACVRLDGMVRGRLPLHPQEACTRAGALLESADDRELDGLWETLSVLGTAVPDVPESILIRAVACQRMGRLDACRPLWLELLEGHASREMQYQAHSALTDMFDLQGPCPDTALFQEHAIGAARTAADFATARACYARAGGTWSWAEMRPEVRFHADREGEDREDPWGKRVVDWWVTSLSTIRQLAKKPSPVDWARLVGMALGWIEEEEKNGSDLAGLLAGAIDAWTRSVLDEAPDLSSVRALRIGLIAGGRTGSSDELAAECLEFLNQADEHQRSWLSTQLQSSRVDSGHHTTEIVLAELAFRQGDYGAADSSWRVYLNDPPFPISRTLLSHVFSRLCDLHGPQSPMPDMECFQAALLLRGSLAGTFEERQDLYREVVPNWNVARLQEELRSRPEFRESECALDLLASWTQLHPRTDGSEVVLSLLQSLPKALLDAKDELVNRLLGNLQPRIVADHPVFGRRYLGAVLTLIAARERHGDMVGRRSVITSHLSASQLEFLVCAALGGLLGSHWHGRIWLPQTVFADVPDNVASELAVRCAPLARELIVSGGDDVFFGYQPESSRTLDRWLIWFGAILLESDALASRVIVVVKKVLHKALAANRSEVESFVTVCEEHGIQEHVPDFPLFKAFVDAVQRVERESGIACVREPSSEQIAAVIRTFDSHRDDLHRDILVAILRVIYHRMNRSWPTPLIRLVETLITAGRVEEAEAAAQGAVRERMFEANRMPVSVLLASYKGPKREPPPYDPQLRKLAELFLKPWFSG